MGYTADGSLAELYSADFVDDVAHEIVERVGDRLHKEVVPRTPVADMPPAYDAVPRAGGRTGWIKSRKGRRPGTARRSWRTSAVQRLPNGTWRVIEDTDDPVMIYLEQDTRPHLIRARKPGGYLRFPMGLQFLYRRQVHHPGTQGHHMMRDSLAVIEGAWQDIANEVLEEEAVKANRVPAPLFPLRP